MKTYVKPDLYYESFELSQNIAVCGWDMNNMDKNNCTALGDTSLGNFEVFLFTSTNKSCEATESDVAESYCYEPGTGAWGLFNS